MTISLSERERTGNIAIVSIPFFSAAARISVERFTPKTAMTRSLIHSRSENQVGGS